MMSKIHWTPLHDAAQNGHCEVVHYLITCGANVNAVDNVSCCCINSEPDIASFYCLETSNSIVLCCP